MAPLIASRAFLVVVALALAACMGGSRTPSQGTPSGGAAPAGPGGAAPAGPVGAPVPGTSASTPPPVVAMIPPPPAPSVPAATPVPLVPGALYTCVRVENGVPIAQAVAYAPAVEALCRRHPEMGPCQYERDACRRAGGRVYTAEGVEITRKTEEEYDRRVTRVRLPTN